MFEGKSIIIFDMDGTLIDSVGIWNKVDRRLIESFGKKALSDREIQHTRDDILERKRGAQNPYLEYCACLNELYDFGQNDPGCVLKKRYDIAHDFLRKEIDYKPMADVFVKELVKLGCITVIASTTKRSNMDIYRQENANIMSKAAIDECFSKVYTREDVGSIKPDPEVYLKVMEDFEAGPEKCLVFEDSLVGIKAAKSAGIDTVAVHDMYSDDERKEINRNADHIIGGYEEAVEILKKERG